MTFLVTQKNDLARKMRLISSIMTSQPEEKNITKHILSNISIGKENQTMKFGPLI